MADKLVPSRIRGGGDGSEPGRTGPPPSRPSLGDLPGPGERDTPAGRWVGFYSTCLKGGYYDPGRRYMELQFVSTGRIYPYADVEEDTWANLYWSLSRGAYYSAHIKGNYGAR